MLICLLVGTDSLVGQMPSPTETPAESLPKVGGYKVSSNMEFGVRWVDQTGSENKYKSDLNYRTGFRMFDSSLLLEADHGTGRIFDSLLVSSTGWGSDPTGYARVSLEKLKIYKLDANVRRVTYFNNLLDHALNQHTQDTRHTFGDVDLVLLPQNRNIRFNLGASFSNNRGPGVFTTRAYGDEFAVNSFTRSRNDDFRFGVEGMLAGFNLAVTQGLRVFTDRTNYDIEVPSLGNNPTNNARLTTFERSYPVDGDASYTQFNAQRTFAKRFDFSARFIYSSTASTSGLLEVITGRDSSNNFVDLDQFQISGFAKRIQKRGDLGMTVLATDKLRISNTFSYDGFAINGGEEFEEALFRRNAAGNPLATAITRSTGYRVNDYLRYSNLLEADYQAT
ncbi:MAG: hypothetical protein AB7J13_11575, partial [Pyrinomonadaceae bacterium]